MPLGRHVVHKTKGGIWARRKRRIPEAWGSACRRRRVFCDQEALRFEPIVISVASRPPRAFNFGMNRGRHKPEF
jgi:hypothetical protein